MEDILTQRHAQTVAFDYNLAPYAYMKTERALTPETDLNSVWLATKDHVVRCFVKYHADELPQ